MKLFISLLLLAQLSVKLGFTGDVDPQMLQNAAARPKLAAAVADCDVVVGNLECALTRATVPLPSKAGAHVLAGPTRATVKARDYLLQAPPETARWVAEAGFTLINLANNHTMDYGVVGLRDTLAALTDAGLQWCGAGLTLGAARAPAYVQVGEVRVAFIGYSEIAPLGSKATDVQPGIAWFAWPPGAVDRARVLGSIKQARSAGANLVIVNLHWGKEGSGEIEPYQRTFAQALVTGGADAVIGHHPHVLRGVESYGGKTIAYSLGNYLFSKGTSRTLLLKLEFTQDADGVWRQRALPAYLRVRGGIPQVLR